ncbi:ribosome maturation factor RimP [Leucothrix pacifica]|uniref:Ribosome maturation factor RimP n=1 Tax=Leucothrix pacifica TaxID=1247513 RepID=A0A317CKT0_9GAMM|nr:ribosome maturation factor RimP [Leucothrix pacifica]PWQ99106.1 ribosome maturation factor RimP [Leucothrix pacifica]
MHEQLDQLINSTVVGLGFELWGYEYRPHSESALLRIFIEKEGGISIDNCTQVSRQIGAALDVEDLIPVAYILEVSSPGIDRVLFTPEQYHRYIGEQLKVRTRSPIEGRRNFRGSLEAATDTHVSVLVDNETFEIPFDVVDRARLVMA